MTSEKIVIADGSGINRYSHSNNYCYISHTNILEETSSFAECYSYDYQSSLFNFCKDFTSPFASIRTPIDVDSGILPPGVRYVGKNYVVFERPPVYQNIFYIPMRVEEMRDVPEYDDDDDDDQEYTFEYFDFDAAQTTYRIPLPWQLYIATFDDNYLCASVHMYFMNTSLFSTDQPLGSPTVPNFFTNGLLCRPMFDSMTEIDRYDKNIKGVIESAYDWVWNNGTNNDLNETLVHLCIQQPNHPIFNNVPQERRYLLAMPSTHHYLDPSRVSMILTSWEKLSIPEVLNHPWPNISFTTHFDYTPINNTYPSNYDDLLREWLASDYYEATENYIDSDDLENIIENEDYSVSDFHSYLRDAGYMTDPTYSWNTPITYKQMLQSIIKSIPYGSKNHSLSQDISQLSYQINQTTTS